MSLNSCHFMGRLTRDPELRYTQSQKPVVSFSLAVDRDYVAPGAERAADFVDCFAWNGLAEHIAKWFKKGTQAVVHGRLEGRDWTDNDGNKRHKDEIRVESIYFASPKAADAQPRELTASPMGDLTDAEGNLPF